MKIYIVTGGSRGIGHALATILEAEGYKVLRVSRNNPDQLPNHIALDLTQPGAAEQVIAWLEPYLHIASEITLINNAGVVQPIEQIGKLDSSAIAKAIDINIKAPIELSNRFVEATQNLPIMKRIVNISSGAGRHVYSGWSIYCATKAAIDHFSRALHLEQKQHQHPIYVTALAPGVIDTDMQVEIRASSPTAFPHIERFLQLKEQNQLLSPHQAAEAIIRYFNSPLMTGDEPIADIRDLP